MQQTKAIQSCVVDEAETVASKVPSILKRLGSSVPMVEDLEWEHQNEQQSSGTNVLPSSSSMTANFPLSKTTKFMTQLSSSENQSSSDLLQSFNSNYLGQTSTIVSNLPTVCDILNPNSVLDNIDPFFAQELYHNPIIKMLHPCNLAAPVCPIINKIISKGFLLACQSVFRKLHKLFWLYYKFSFH